MTKYGIMVVFFIVMSESAIKLCVICTALLAIIIFGCNRTVVVRFSWYQPCNLVVYVTNVMSCVKLLTCLKNVSLVFYLIMHVLQYRCQICLIFMLSCYTVSVFLCNFVSVYFLLFSLNWPLLSFLKICMCSINFLLCKCVVSMMLYYTCV